MRKKGGFKAIYTLFLGLALQLNVVKAEVVTPPKEEVKVEESYIKKPLITETKITPTYPARKFPWGWCTYYVSEKIDIPWRGDAKYWLANAKEYDYETGREAKIGAIVVTSESRFGHVAIVEEVDQNDIEVSEMNYEGFGKVSKRKIAKNSPLIKGYIYN